MRGVGTIQFMRCGTYFESDNATTYHEVKVVDTVLAKIFAEDGKTSDLHNLLESSNHIVISEFEPVLKKTRRYQALCLVYKQRGEDDKLLDAWSRQVASFSVRTFNKR